MTRRNTDIPPRLPSPPSDLIVIRFQPPAKVLNENDRLHWGMKMTIVRAWRDRAAWAALATIGRGRLLQKSTVSVVLPVRTNRRRDPHNFTPTLKAIIDGLVDVGVFADDDESHVVTTEPGFTRYGTDVVVTITPFLAGNQ